MVERAPSFEVAPLILGAYGLTGRERDVMQHLIRGQSNKEIASVLNLSTYTVSDYLKTIFEKMGVRSRGEVAARVFFDHYFPHGSAAVVKTRRRLKVSPARLKALRLHGRYLGYMRQLKSRAKADVRALRAKKGSERRSSGHANWPAGRGALPF
jgi:DNA-binding CsgD family transcriptional regulator